MVNKVIIGKYPAGFKFLANFGLFCLFIGHFWSSTMYSVLIPTPDNDGIMNPGVAPDPRKVVYTRRGRLYVSLHKAQALARRHLGKVIDVNSGRAVADYL